MAKFRGNIFTKAAGSIGSMTFSQARDRNGKVQTARQRVVPLNPQTPGQVSARDNLSDSNFISKRMQQITDINAFDRSISKLPGYQSVVSWFQRVKSTSGTDIVFNSPPPELSLGSLWAPAITGLSSFSDGTWQISWSTSTGDNGQSDDIIKGAALTQEFPIADIGSFRVLNMPASIRSDGSAIFDLNGFGDPTSGGVFLLWAEPAPSNLLKQASSVNTAFGAY